MFPTRLNTISFAEQRQAEALEVWRAAADLVSQRWHTFLAAGSECRRWAFASYVSALDAESAAAADLAAAAAHAGGFCSRKAA